MITLQEVIFFLQNSSSEIKGRVPDGTSEIMGRVPHGTTLAMVITRKSPDAFIER